MLRLVFLCPFHILISFLFSLKGVRGRLSMKCLTSHILLNFSFSYHLNKGILWPIITYDIDCPIKSGICLNLKFLLIVQETKMYCWPPETYVAEMTTPREFNLTTTLEEIHNKTGKMQIVTGQERTFE